MAATSMAGEPPALPNWCSRTSGGIPAACTSLAGDRSQYGKAALVTPLLVHRV